METKIPVSDKIKAAYNKLKADTKVQKALKFIVPDQEKRLEEQIAIAKIPGFSYHEAERAKAMKEYFKQYGLTDIQEDCFGNVYAVRRGRGNGPSILVDAHMDSVFPMYTELEPKLVGSRVYMPGITDDASGLSAMLSVLRALNDSEIETVGDIWFAGTVEEEPGIFGMHKFLSKKNDFDAVIALDCAGFGWFAVGYTGECIVEVRFRNKEERIHYGKYSSCLTAASRAALKIAQFQPLEKTMVLVDSITSDPNKGQGCTTSLTTLKIAIRCCNQALQDQTEKLVRNLIEEAVKEENAVCGEVRTVSYEILKNVLLSPADQDWNNPVCGSLYHIFQDMGVEKPGIVETGNANGGAALRCGIQSVTMGTGGEHGGIHSLEEYYDTTDMHKGPQSILLQALMMAGMKNVIEPQAK